ncbi:phytanoyl-CoA dioxygenase family protein [Archangium lipolyticum]|uniref:phytanoyl-CoA dioxygenase family protein n=1 Tax=Archangium lipolyticum TaxID=2970465 RepID=UPI00214A7C3D|nr:phytanoyl-CoA dioxygenase family protein [Archangium lipolyticum]
MSPDTPSPFRIQTQPPSDPEAFRRALYAGALYKLAPGEASLRLVREVNGLLAETFRDVGDVREAQFHLPPAEHLERLGRVRRVLAGDARLHQGARAVLAAAGLEPGEYAIDVPRLRGVLHRGHEIPAAAPAYFVHRDTWYANPRTQLNWWLALHDASEEETFTFFPEVFERPVPNSSAAFDYRTWLAQAGWQNPKRKVNAEYPTATVPLDGMRELGFACRAGEVLVFSAAHLHGTRPHISGRTRFSVDFRVVHLEDHRRGLGAPDVDNRSTGSALEDYLPPTAASAGGSP